MSKQALQEMRLLAGVGSRYPTVAEARANRVFLVEAMQPGLFYKNKRSGDLFRAIRAQKNGSMAGVKLDIESRKAVQTQVDSTWARDEWELVGKEAPEDHAKDAVMSRFAAKIAEVEADLEAEKNKKPELAPEEVEILRMACKYEGYFSADKTKTNSLWKQKLIVKAKAPSNRWTATPEGRALMKQIDPSFKP